MIEGEVILQRGDMFEFEVKIQTGTHIISRVPFLLFSEAAAFALNNLCEYRQLVIGDNSIQEKWREWLIEIGQINLGNWEQHD